MSDYNPVYSDYSLNKLSIPYLKTPVQHWTCLCGWLLDWPLAWLFIVMLMVSKMYTVVMSSLPRSVTYNAYHTLSYIIIYLICYDNLVKNRYSMYLVCVTVHVGSSICKSWDLCTYIRMCIYIHFNKRSCTLEDIKEHVWQ